MSYSSIEIKNLPPADDIKDEDLVILEKENFTAAAPAGSFKNYLLEEIAGLVTANTYTAGEGLLLSGLSGGEFSIKDDGVTEAKLDPLLRSKIGSFTGTITLSALSGVVSTYTTPITAEGEFMEIWLQPGPLAAPQRYAIRVYKI
jgi:hypothetical protein